MQNNSKNIGISSKEISVFPKVVFKASFISISIVAYRQDDSYLILVDPLQYKVALLLFVFSAKR